MRTEALKRTILRLFRRREFYGYDIQGRLEMEGVEVELSRLYRVLNEMEREGLLEGRWVKSSSGPRRKMYNIGDGGREVLRKVLLEAIGTVHSFYGDYLLDLYPEIRVFDEIFDWISSGLEGGEIVAYLVGDNSPMHEIVIGNLVRRVPRGKVYVVVSENMTRELKADSWSQIAGESDDIPLKDGFVDMLLTITLPGEEDLERCLQEFRRVLNVGGVLGIMTPSILVEEQRDPLTIGDYIEMYEHEVIERGERLSKGRLRSAVGELFGEIDEMQLVHMTLLKAKIV